MVDKFLNVALIDTKSVAARLGVSISSVLRLVDSGELQPSMKAPGKRGAFFFDPAVVDQLETESAR